MKCFLLSLLLCVYQRDRNIIWCPIKGDALVRKSILARSYNLIEKKMCSAVLERSD